jgi:hypothetical protein
MLKFGRGFADELVDDRAVRAIAYLKYDAMRAIGLVAAGLAVCGTHASTAPGYLPVAGPAPLRFEPPPVHPLPLPPFVSEKDSLSKQGHSSASVNDGVASPGGPASHRSDGLTSSRSLLPTLMDSLSSTNMAPLIGSDTNSPSIVSPQLLMRYFLERMATNDPSASRAPLSFSPPLPPPIPSSSATYSSPPAP